MVLKKRKPNSNGSEELSWLGKSYCEGAINLAESKWRKGKPDFALDLIRTVIRKHRDYADAYRLMAEILMAEGYADENVIWCFQRLQQLRPLSPEESLMYGLRIIKTGEFEKVLPLLEKVTQCSTVFFEETGIDPGMIKRILLSLRTQLETSSLQAGSGVDRKSKKSGGSGSIFGKAFKTSKKTAVKGKPVSPRVSREKKVTGRKLKQSSSGRIKLPNPEPKAPPKPEPPKIHMTALIRTPDDLYEHFLSGKVANIKKYLLAQEASRFSQADHFDNLICVNTLKGVEQYAYQVDTVRKVMRSFRGRVLLADEVGLGKTIEAGMVLKEYLMRGMVKKALILTPPALTSQWCEELAAKFQIKAVSTDSPELRQDPEHFWKNNDLIVASLALARNKHHRPLLTHIGFDMVIVDEAHHVKNDRTVGWKLINELKSRFLLLLSATPVENNLMDLFSLVTLLKPGQLGTKTAFRRQFVLRGDPTQPRNREELRGLIGEVMIRNTRALADIKLPPRHAVTVLVEGAPAERELYARLTDLVRKGFQNNMNRLSLGLLLQEAGSSPGAVRKTLLKLCEHPRVDSDFKKEMGKLARLCDYVPDTAKTSRLLDLLKVSREKVLVFSRFTATLEDIGKRLSEAGVDFSMFKGKMSASEKDQAVLNFQNGCNVMLCSEIGGEGRNLQFCSTMVNYDLPWNPMKIEQRIGRIHRIGQTRPVHVYNLCADNTAEHHILDVLDKRINLFELVIGEVDLVLGQTKSEMEFEERILDIYGRSRNDQDIAQAFETLGDELLAARKQYDKVKKLDSEIFANDYEI